MNNPFEQISQKLETLQQQSDEMYKVVSRLADVAITQGKSDNDIIRMDEVCVILGLSKSTIYGLRSRREIPCLANGRFLRSDVMRWLESQRLRTKAEIKAEPL